MKHFTFDEYLRTFYPKQYEAEQLAKMTPKECGEKIARDALNVISRTLVRHKIGCMTL